MLSPALHKHKPRFIITGMRKKITKQRNRTTHVLKWNYCKTGVAIPLQAWKGPEVSRRLRLPDLKTIGTWRWQGFHPNAPAAFTPRKHPWYSFLLEAESTPGAIVRLEGLCQWKKFNDTIGNRTRDIPACSAVPQPTAPPLVNPLNTDLNPICHLLALLGAHHILHVSRIRVN